MSRIRIVGGAITKTTEGAHHMYSEENIVFNSSKAITEVGEKNGIVYGEPKDAPKIKMETKDFDITFVLDKNEKTIVPFGIKDFKNKEENQFVKFKLKVSGDGINHWQLDIKNQEGVIYTCYSATQELSEVVITSKSKKATANSGKEKPQETSSPSFWPAGEYIICWDGFDNNDIYDSTLFNSKKLEAKITATKEGKQKSATVDFTTEYNQVQWTDVKIDKKAKRIDITLRVELTDGGANGLKCSTYNVGDEMSYETFTPTTNQPDPLKDIKTTICDWDKIPQSEINLSQPIIKTRTQNFADLEKLAIQGLNYHWGRNKNHFIAKDVKMKNESYEFYMNAKNEKENAMVTIDLIYNTNSSWGRSGNPGVLARIYYNEGYLKYSNGWGYQEFGKAKLEYKHTSGHEIGHSILKTFGGTVYSWQHKGSSYLLPQDEKPVKGNETFSDNFKIDNMKEMSGEYYPQKGEIDLMKYYNYEYDKTTNRRIPVEKIEERSVATEQDLMMLIWLTKIKIL
jgi:hypothetical protein